MVDNGKISTYVISLMGIGAGLYFMFQSAINGYLTEMGLSNFITGIAFFAGVGYNYAYPRANDLIKELMKGGRGG